MKKVLIITHDVESNSGWGRYSSEIISRLKKYNSINVQVITEDSRGSDTLNFPTLRKTNSFLNFLKNIYTVRNISKSVDIVHAFDGWPYSVYGYSAVLGTNKSLFINGVGTYSVAPFSSKIKGFLLRLSYEKAKEIFCISSFTALKVVKNVPKAKVSVVHLGLSKLPVLNDDKKREYLKKFDIDINRKPIILTVGAIKSRKGQLETLKSIGLLKEKFDKIQYLIVGQVHESNYFEMIKKYALENNLNENVFIFNNIQNDQELSFFYQIADVFALNSQNDSRHFEGFGLVILEAGQFGVPSVGSKNSGIEDAIIHNKTGFLVEESDEVDIAENLHKLLSNFDGRYRKEAEVYAKNFTWDKTVTSYINSYEKML